MEIPCYNIILQNTMVHSMTDPKQDPDPPNVSAVIFTFADGDTALTGKNFKSVEIQYDTCDYEKFEAPEEKGFDGDWIMYETESNKADGLLFSIVTAPPEEGVDLSLIDRTIVCRALAKALCYTDNILLQYPDGTTHALLKGKENDPEAKAGIKAEFVANVSDEDLQEALGQYALSEDRLKVKYLYDNCLVPRP